MLHCTFQVADYKKKAEEEADAAALLEEQKKKMAKDIDMLQHKLDELQMIHEKLDKSKRKLQSEVCLYVSFLLLCSFYFK